MGTALADWARMSATAQVRSAELVGYAPPPFAARARSTAPPQFMADLVHVLPQVQSYARQLSQRAADAEDLVQETCRRAIEAHTQFSPGSNLRAWLLCILRNHHRDRLRRAGREIALGDGIDDLPAEVAEDARPPAWMIVSDEDTALALTSLPPVFRNTYVLYAIRGLSYSEIAAQLRIPCATVGTRLRRARARLRRFLLQRSGAEERFRPHDPTAFSQPST